MDVSPLLLGVISAIVTSTGATIVAVITGRNSKKVVREERGTPSYSELDSRNSILERMNSSKGNLIWRLEQRIMDLINILTRNNIPVPPEDADLKELRDSAWKKDREEN